MSETPPDADAAKKKAGRPVADAEKKLSGLQVLGFIKTRLKTGHHSVDSTRGQRTNVNRQLNLFEYDPDSDKLFKKDAKGKRLEVLLCSETKKLIFDEAHAGHPRKNTTVANIHRDFYWRHI